MRKWLELGHEVRPVNGEAGRGGRSLDGEAAGPRRGQRQQAARGVRLWIDAEAEEIERSTGTARPSSGPGSKQRTEVTWGKPEDVDPARVELEQGLHGGVGFGLCKPQRQQRIRTTVGRLKRERSTRGRRKREGEVPPGGGAGPTIGLGVHEVVASIPPGSGTGLPAGELGRTGLRWERGGDARLGELRA